MMDRISTQVLSNGAVRYGVYDEDENLLRYEYIKAEDEPSQMGTPLNKATLLRDETAEKLGLTQSNPTVDDAFNELFQSVSDGKELVASAITDKGVTTAPDATFQTMSENIEKISTIPPNVCTITLTASPSAGGTVSGGGYASKNMKVQVNASPASGYTFEGWKKNGSLVSSNANYLFQVTGSTILVANFSEWVWQTSTLPSTEAWDGVTYGGGKFVAVASLSNQQARIAYSADGINWKAATSSLPYNWKGVTYGNGKFVTVGVFSDKAAYSNDGVTWTLTTLPSNESWSSVAYGNGKFVAVATLQQKAAYSNDGINWIATTLPPSTSGYSVTYGNSRFVAVGGTAKAAYSNDGINWIATDVNNLWYWESVTYGGGKFVAVASNGGKAAYSTDGITWATATLSSSGGWYSVTYGNGRFVAVGSGGKTAYSNDGINWAAATLPSTEDWRGVAYGDGKFVAVAKDSNKAAYALV